MDDLRANEQNHQPGNFYLVDGELWFWDAEHGDWASAGHIQGPPGPQGAPGPAGPEGAPGRVGTIAGSFDSYADLVANEHNHVPGNFYLVGGDLWFWSDEQGRWENAGPLAGPAGPQGPTGPMPQISVNANGHLVVNGSDTGVSLVGPQGLQGPQGDKGDAGSIGTIAGSFDSLEDLIANEHNHQPGNFYLIGGHLWFWSEEQGRWEDAGPIEGPPGPKGDTGPMPQITVNDEGHLVVDGEDTGQSLKGPQGPAGAPGRDGTDGAKGDTGPMPQISISPGGTLIINGEDTGVSLIGPQGPAGPSGEEGGGGVQKGIQAELTDAQQMNIPQNGVIPFNVENLSIPSSGLSYDPATYTFTISQPGVYAIDWWLGVISGLIPAPSYAEVGISVNGTIGHIVSQTATISSNMAGHDLLNVTTVPTTIQLVNVSNGIISLGRGATQGGFLITG